MYSRRLRSRIQRQSAIWAVPAAYVVSALGGGWLLSQIGDRLFGARWTPVFTSGAATSILTAIVSGMLSFTGFVFSMTFIMVQFGSSQYSPRLSGYLLRDVVVRHALGMFISTFVYALVALTVVNTRGAGIVVDIAVTSALLTVLGSVVFFLALIQRVTVLQVTNVLHQIGALGRAVIEHVYPPASEPGAADEEAFTIERARLPAVTATVHFHGGPMAVVEVRIDALAKLAQQDGAVIELEYAVGDTLSDGAALMRVRGGSGRIKKSRLWDEVTVGPQRTIEQDPKYAIRLIVDIAIRALSPAVNDPTTAVQALDELEDLLRRIGSRRLHIGYARDKQGIVRVIYPTPDWEDFVTITVTEIRQYGATSMQVMRRLHAMLADLLGALPPDRRGPLEYQLQQLIENVPRKFVDPDDRTSALEIDRQGIGLSRPSDPAP